jgi:hypothetical protein
MSDASSSRVVVRMCLQASTRSVQAAHARQRETVEENPDRGKHRHPHRNEALRRPLPGLAEPPC